MDGCLHAGIRVNELEESECNVFDFVSNKIIKIDPCCIENLHDWREHKYELLYTPLLDTIKWEIHIRDSINRSMEHPWKILKNRSELSGKEWMYKWIYVWSREVDFPLGGWARGVVLHYRSITGKHFVWFENEDVLSGWMYLNNQYIIIEGINNEYIE